MRVFPEVQEPLDWQEPTSRQIQRERTGAETVEKHFGSVGLGLSDRATMFGRGTARTLHAYWPRRSRPRKRLLLPH